MLRSKKFLSVLLLAVTLAPFAAQAQTAPQPAPGVHQTAIVQSGVNYLRDSFGG